jgi:hypothetical protein
VRSINDLETQFDDDERDVWSWRALALSIFAIGMCTLLVGCKPSGGPRVPDISDPLPPPPETLVLSGLILDEDGTVLHMVYRRPLGGGAR